MLITSLVRFPPSEKEEVSGIEMLNALSSVVFDNFGNKIKLVGLDDVRWPYPLKQGEEALVRMQDRGKRVIKGVPLRFFYAEMYGVVSGRVVLRCQFFVLEPAA